MKKEFGFCVSGALKNQGLIGIDPFASMCWLALICVRQDHRKIISHPIVELCEGRNTEFIVLKLLVRWLP